MPIASFHDVVFPLPISFGATGGPERRIEVAELTSGREQRNARQAHSKRRYDAGTGVRSISDLREIISFFEARRGKLTAFRFRDPFDNTSRDDGLVVTPADQTLGTGDGTLARFKLVKNYGGGADAYARPIRKPVVRLACVWPWRVLKRRFQHTSLLMTRPARSSFFPAQFPQTAKP